MRPSAVISFLSRPTCLSWTCFLSALEDRDGCKLLSSELQRDSSGESRWQRSLDRPRSLSPCCQCSERDTGKNDIRQATPSQIKRMWSHIYSCNIHSLPVSWQHRTMLAVPLKERDHWRWTDRQPCSFCDEGDRFSQGFSPPAKGHWPADRPPWRLSVSWSRLNPPSAGCVAHWRTRRRFHKSCDKLEKVDFCRDMKGENQRHASNSAKTAAQLLINWISCPLETQRINAGR